MKTLKTLLAAALLLSASVASADSITNHFNDLTGNYFLSGTIYSASPDVLGNVSGIGFINNIQNDANQIVWSSGQYGSWVNFIFSGFNITSMSAPTGPAGSQAFTENLGTVSFYSSNTAAAFQATGNQIADAAHITSLSSPSFVTLAGATQNTVDNIPFSTYGNVASTSFDAHGAMNVIGGLNAASFDTNSISFLNLFANDLSFDFTGSNIHTFGYVYSGVANAKGNISPVPEPSQVLMMGIGLLIIGLKTRKKGSFQALAA